MAKLDKSELKELNALADATQHTYPALASLLDVDERTLMRWMTGVRPPRHPAMLKKALQLIVLEQRGVITDKLIEQPSR
jgi:hypothetical protein